MSTYVLRGCGVTAMRVTEARIETVASWCGGAIKGILLPPAEMVIEVNDRGEEYTASVGDWVVRFYGDDGHKYIRVFDDEFFRSVFVLDNVLPQCAS